MYKILSKMYINNIKRVLYTIVNSINNQINVSLSSPLFSLIELIIMIMVKYDKYKEINVTIFLSLIK